MNINNNNGCQSIKLADRSTHPIRYPLIKLSEPMILVITTQR